MDEIFDVQDNGEMEVELKPILKVKLYDLLSTSSDGIEEPEESYQIRFLKHGSLGYIGGAEGLTAQELLEVTHFLNSRRRVLSYRAPKEVFTTVNAMRDPRLIHIAVRPSDTV